MNDQIERTRSALAEFLAAEVGALVAIEDLRPLAGGASREAWALTAVYDDQREALVLRLDMATTMNPEALARAEEFLLMRHMFAAGVRCPRPRWLCSDPSVLGAPFFLMEYVHGESIGPRVVRSPQLATARQQLPRQMAEQLAKIHEMDVGGNVFAFLPAPAPRLAPAQHTINGLRQSLANLRVSSPGLTAGLRWLERNQPKRQQQRLVHGDFRIGNLVVDDEGLAAVIDWEFAHIGDPIEDLAWPLVRDWRFGHDHLRLGGIADAEPFLVTYEELTQQTVSRSAIGYWEIMGNMKWAVTCLVQAKRHLSGEDPNIELASLGRRSAEMELELLSLIAEHGSL